MVKITTLAGVDAALARAANVTIVRPSLGLHNEMRIGDRTFRKPIHTLRY
jgi:hypothetical protein